MIKLVNSWANKSDLETIVLKALKIITGLFLQKTLNSKSKELKSTETKIIARENGQLDQLMFEGKTIQDRLQNNDNNTGCKQ